jgi:hypothetical protein
LVRVQQGELASLVNVEFTGLIFLGAEQVRVYTHRSQGII